MSNSIRIMTFNTYLLHVPPISIGSLTQNARINAMLKDKIFDGVDVVILQEVFNYSSEKKLLSGMYNQGFIYQTPIAAQYNETVNLSCNANHCWNAKKGRWDIIQQVNSGIAIVSRYPIVFKEYQLFNDAGCGADRFSARGGVRAVIDVNNQLVNIIDTHMQSDNNLCIISHPADHRQTQLKQLIDWAINTSSDDQAIVFGGDFNIDYGSDEYRQALDIIGWGEPNNFKPQPSWDFATNNIIREAAPNERHRWHLDYIFAKNVASIETQTWNIKSETGYAYNNKLFFDYSDHYPVVADITLR